MSYIVPKKFKEMAGLAMIYDGASSKAHDLRALLGADKVVRAVGAHDAMTARLVEAAGFDAVWVSSFGLSTSHGVPDAGLLTMTQYLDAAEDIDAATGLPVIADCDTGFGGPLNVEHLVHRYERRGIAAICIEDKQFPKMNSFASVEHKLLPTEQFVQKVQSGKAAQRHPDFMVIARTEAFIAGLDLGAALKRGYAYGEAGADAILVHSRMEEPDQVLAFAAHWQLDVPLVAVPTTYHGVHEQELYKAGYRLVIYANQVIRAEIQAVSSMLAGLAQEGRAGAVERDIASIRHVLGLQGMETAIRERR